MPDPTKQKDSVTSSPESGDRDTSGPPGTRSAEPTTNKTGPVSPGQSDVGEDFESGNPAPK